MNSNDFIEQMQKRFLDFGVLDTTCINTSGNNTLIIPIEKEGMIPSYKIAIYFLDDEFLTMNACFRHNAILKKEMYDLLKTIDNFNSQSFIKFNLEKEYLKISYTLPVNLELDLDKAISVTSIIPNLISEYFVDLKKFLK